MASFPGTGTMKFPEIKKPQALTGTKLPEPLPGLPLVLCGPLLRKVYYDNVSVWLAFKDEVKDIRLEVFEARNPSNVILSGLAPTALRLGKNLHVILITALSKGTKLVAGTIYGYRVSFSRRGTVTDLATVGVLKGGIASVSYDPFNFPTFCLPADNINDLKIVHGSCRKPHGGTTDALRALDTMIEINSNDAKERPQLVCLTGDQIYADDVADALLHKINLAKDLLLGWKDTLPGTVTHAKEYTPAELRPGNRKNFIARTGNKSTGFGSIAPGTGITDPVTPDDLTTTDAKSHLIFLSEFLLMYLFAYSDTFIKENDWPVYEAVYSLPSDKTNAGKRKEYAAEIAGLDSFAKSLPYIKKALANVSSVMIFDDHEITDDWFLSREWSKAALTEKTISRRYILNGLTAYAVFQDWGNDYTKYLPGSKGYEILQALTNNNLTSQQRIQIISPILLPTLERNNKEYYKSWYLKSAFRWNYIIQYKAFDLCVMNTRTERIYYDGENSVSTLTARFWQAGVQGNTAKLLVLVSAYPVFGNIKMEEGQEQLRDKLPFEVAGFASRWTRNTGLYEKDQEAWAFSHKGFEGLLSFLSVYKKVLILSGDVHYSYTSYVKLWRESKDSGKATYDFTEIVQSTSSAMKNSNPNLYITVRDKKTLVHVVVKTGTPYKLIKVTASKFDEHSALRNIENPQYRDIERFIQGFHDLAMPPEFSIAPFQFSMQYIRSGNFNPADPLFRRIAVTAQNKRFTDRSAETTFNPVVVAKDSLSILSFTANSITSNIWYASGRFDDRDQKESNRLMFPYTKHQVQLTGKYSLNDIPLNDLLKRTRVRIDSEVEMAY